MVRVSASIRNARGEHTAVVSTGNAETRLTIQAKKSGSGSSVNGGELLAAALATCYCNDIYREAAKRGIRITSVEVEVSAEFGGEGEAASRIEYSAKVAGSASQRELLDLMAATDQKAEIQNTVRRGVPVSLRGCEAIEEERGGPTRG